MLSATTLRVLALTLLLQACATTPTTPQAEAGDPAQPRQAHAQGPRTAAPTPNMAEKPEPEFDGPQVVFKPGSAELPADGRPHARRHRRET